MQIYLVGGAVRDSLLNIPVVDHDWVVVGATPAELLALGYQQVGKDFPVFLNPDSHEEYALARTERKSGQGYTGFTCYAAPDVTLEEDLLRRDLTINAIARSAEGELIDPYGGVADLQARVLRHVSDAFGEDPLRVLRVARFNARFAHLGFRIADETLALMRQMAHSGELAALTAERVWKETEKALQSQSPQVYFQVLRDCGALAVLFPEIDALFGVPAPAKWHPEIDTGVHADGVGDCRPPHAGGGRALRHSVPRSRQRVDAERVLAASPRPRPGGRAAGRSAVPAVAGAQSGTGFEQAGGRVP